MLTIGALVELLKAQEELVKSILDGLTPEMKQALWDRHVKRTAWIEAILEKLSDKIIAQIGDKP